MDRDEAKVALSGLLHDLVLATYKEMTGEDYLTLSKTEETKDEKPVEKSQSDGVNRDSTGSGEEGSEKDEEEPLNIYTHPDAPGAKVLQYEDGLVIVSDGSSGFHVFRNFDVKKFTELGWVSGQNKED